MDPKKNISKKTLSYDFLANLRPLYNSNVAKVSIVKWSQIYKKSIRKCSFRNIYFLDPFPIKILIMTFKTYQHRK